MLPMSREREIYRIHARWRGERERRDTHRGLAIGVIIFASMQLAVEIQGSVPLPRQEEGQMGEIRRDNQPPLSCR